MKNYQQLKTQYEERYGLLKTTLKDNTLMYYTSYPCHSYPSDRATYKVSINLDTLKETRIKMKRYYKKGLINENM